MHPINPTGIAPSAFQNASTIVQRSRSLPFDGREACQHQHTTLQPLEAAFGGQCEDWGGQLPEYRRESLETESCDCGTSDTCEEACGDFARKISLLSRAVHMNNDGVRQHSMQSSASENDSNNNGPGRSSFDRLLSDLDSMELASSVAAARRKSEGDSLFKPLMGSVRTRIGGQVGGKSSGGRFGFGGGLSAGVSTTAEGAPMKSATYMTTGGSEHGTTSVADFLANNHPPVVTERTQSTRTGFIIESKPVTSSSALRKFRAGPSEGAHASKIVDGGNSATRSPAGAVALSPPTRPTKPILMSTIDADLLDTYGAHDWHGASPRESADWRKGKTNKNLTPRGERADSSRIVSKAPALSPIRSPIGSPIMSPQRANLMATNLSSHVSANYLELRSERLAQMREDDAQDSGRGYIAEAKRVLDEAMHMLEGNVNDVIATQDDTEAGESGNIPGSIPAHGPPADALSMSPSGALEPLMKHLKMAAGDDSKCRAVLRTLTLLETNLPNREIISGLHGRRILMDVVLKCSADAIDVKENAVQLMWDLDRQAGRSAAGVLNENDLHALVHVLCDTTSCEVASHTLHFLRAAIELPVESRPYISEDGQRSLATKLTSETCCHKHPIPDSAQYCLGETLAQILSDLAAIDEPYARDCLEQILDSLGPCADEVQCQILLTVLSSLAVKHRLVKILVAIDAVSKIHRFTNTTTNSRLHARGFSLWKVLSSNVPGSRKVRAAGSWYFLDDDK